MKKKIVYVVGDLSYPNGMSRVLSQKVNWLAEHTDYELYVVLTEKANMPWYYQLSPKIKEVVNFNLNFDDIWNMPFHRRLAAYFQKQRHYKKLFTQYLMTVRPDITVSVVRREINFINGIKDGSKKVGEIHFTKKSNRVFDKKHLPQKVNRLITHWWQESLERKLRQLDKFVVLTEEDATLWHNIPSMTVIPNPIYNFPSHASPCSKKQVVAVGRYTWIKGFDLLIDAWALTSKRHPDWLLRIYGPGDSSPFRRMIAEKGLQDVACCEGPIDNVYECFNESSVFVLSSRFEGFALVLAEAMASGLACVAFDCPCGPRSIIHHQEDGLLVANGDIKALAEGIDRLIADETLRRRYGQLARKNVERFKEDNIMKKWIELFNGL